MKKLLTLIALSFFIISCEKEEDTVKEPDITTQDLTKTTLSLKLTKVNSKDTKEYVFKDLEADSKAFYWNKNSLSKIEISEKLKFKLKLSETEELPFEISLILSEDEDLLNLDNEVIKISEWETNKKWSYKSIELKKEKFYNNNLLKKITRLDQKIPSTKESIIDIVKVTKIKINGEEKLRIELEINGELYGAYTPEMGEGYKIEGVFSGIIE